jgi:hypothetical protein
MRGAQAGGVMANCDVELGVGDNPHSVMSKCSLAGELPSHTDGLNNGGRGARG